MSEGDLRTSRVINKDWSVFKQPHPLSLLLHNARSRQLPAEKTTVESLFSPNSYLPPFPRVAAQAEDLPGERSHTAGLTYDAARRLRFSAFHDQVDAVTSVGSGVGHPHVPPPLRLTRRVLGLGGESSPGQGSPISLPAWPLGRDEACPRSPNFINIPAWNQVSARAFRQRRKPAARLHQGAPRLPSLLQKHQRVAGGRVFSQSAPRQPKCTHSHSRLFIRP